MQAAILIHLLNAVVATSIYVALHRRRSAAAGWLTRQRACTKGQP